MFLQSHSITASFRLSLVSTASCEQAAMSRGLARPTAAHGIVDLVWRELTVCSIGPGLRWA